VSVFTVVIANAIVATTMVATLAYVCRIPYRLNRVHPAKELPVATEPLAQPALAA
jgi:hypothetical protein